jgi:putative transposase
MAEVLKVSRSGYYKWLNRPISKRETANKYWLNKIKEIYIKSKRSYGSVKITKKLNDAQGVKVNHKRVERLMQVNNIRSKVCRKYKNTTDSNHRLPVAPNILNRDFTTTAKNQKMVSDITYIATDEGWLYVASILDLHGRKVVGLSMSDRINKMLVCNALDDAKHRAGKTSGCILHSDRGSVYCSNQYQQLLKEYGFICSMSRKGNCWDNAPMESFWGKLKLEWLDEQHFATRAEATAAVFEYVWIFYNRIRIHASNNYLTPEEYYNKAS